MRAPFRNAIVITSAGPWVPGVDRGGRTRTSDGTDHDLRADLRALQRDVAEPIARSILRDDELEGVRVYREDDAPDEIRVTITARGEAFIHRLSDPSREGHQNLDEVVDRLIDDLEDWVFETRFAWGQQRRASKDAVQWGGSEPPQPSAS